MICVLIAWENKNNINLTKFTKLNFFVDWWVGLGWIFCLFCFVFFFSLDIYYFCIWYVFWLHEKRKMKSTWQNLLNSIFLWINNGLTQYFCICYVFWLKKNETLVNILLLSTNIRIYLYTLFTFFIIIHL